MNCICHTIYTYKIQDISGANTIFEIPFIKDEIYTFFLPDENNNISVEWGKGFFFNFCITDFNKYFISIAEQRDIKINEILG